MTLVFAFILDRQRLSLETKTAFTVEFYGEDISEGLKAEMCILFFCEAYSYSSIQSVHCEVVIIILLVVGLLF